MNKQLQILPNDLLSAYLESVPKGLDLAFETLKDAEISTDNFSFYTSVASVYSSKIEGEAIELDSYIKHKKFGIEFLPDYTKKIDDLYDAYTFAKTSALTIENIALAHVLLSKNPNVKLLSLSNPAGLDKRDFIAPLFLNFMTHFFQRGVKNKPSFQHQFKFYYKNVLITDSAFERRNEIVDNAYLLAPLLVQGWTSFKLKEEDLRPIIKNISCPVLFTWAMKDKFVQFGRNKKAISKFKKQNLIKYPIGHTPYIEIPERFNNDLISFIENH